MRVTVGTFNLNNLFSRFNFRGAINEIQEGGGSAGGMTIRYEFTDPGTFRIRTFLGSLVKGKDPDETATIAQRIIDMDIDVLAVQEVENVEILREFNRDHLGGLYPFVILFEGNDPRFIDVGVLSKLPVGASSSFQTAVHPADTSRPVFGRDLLEVEIFNQQRSEKLFTIYNNHLKSHFLGPGQTAAAADDRRRRQAETIERIVASRQRPNSRFVITGDMNDPPDAATLHAITMIEGQAITDALTNPRETRPAKPETVGPGPQTTAWTHRFKPSGQPPEHKLFDQIWLSSSLAGRQTDAVIDRRTKHGGDGSDHDPAWIELDL